MNLENKLKENNQEKTHHPNKDIVCSNSKCFIDAPLRLRDCQSKDKKVPTIIIGCYLMKFGKHFVIPLFLNDSFY